MDLDLTPITTHQLFAGTSSLNTLCAVFMSKGVLTLHFAEMYPSAIVAPSPQICTHTPFYDPDLGTLTSLRSDFFLEEKRNMHALLFFRAHWKFRFVAYKVLLTSCGAAQTNWHMTLK